MAFMAIVTVLPDFGKKTYMHMCVHTCAYTRVCVRARVHVCMYVYVFR